MFEWLKRKWFQEKLKIQIECGDDEMPSTPASTLELADVLKLYMLLIYAAVV